MTKMKNHLLQPFPGIRFAFPETIFYDKFKEHQVPGTVLSQLKPSLLRKLDLNQWLNATVHFDVFIPINFDNSDPHWTRTLRVAQVDWLSASVHYKSVDFMVLSLTWLFLRLLASGTVQFSSVRLFYSSTLFCLSFRHLLWHFVLTAVRHSHSYIRYTCSSSFSAAFVSFTVRHSHCVRHTPFIDGVRLHEVCISFLLRSYICGSYLILQFIVTSFHNKSPFVYPFTNLPVEQVMGPGCPE